MNSDAPFTVAIDGPAAAGKGTVSKAVAEIFGFAHLDTGLLYRAVGARFLTGEDPVQAAGHLTPDDLAGDLRTAEVAEAASKVAAIPEVRTALVAFQQQFARRSGGAVLDGRDIGTVICPGAEVKLFITASDDVRAKRRFLELTGKGQDTTRDAVHAALVARDKRDSERATAPLKPASDATIIDTSDMSIEDAIQAAAECVRAKYRP